MWHSLRPLFEMLPCVDHARHFAGLPLYFVLSSSYESLIFYNNNKQS